MGRSVEARRTEACLQVCSNNRIGSIWTSHLSASRQRTENVSLGSYSGMYRSTHLDVLWRIVVRLSRAWTQTGGTTHQHESVSSAEQGNVPSASRNVTAVFAGINGAVCGHEIQLNVRHDQFAGYASGENTFYAGDGRQLAHELEAIASCASAFNVPALGSLCYSNPYWAAHPLLKPESAHTAQAALQWSGQRSIAQFVRSRLGHCHSLRPISVPCSSKGAPPPLAGLMSNFASLQRRAVCQAFREWPLIVLPRL